MAFHVESIDVKKIVEQWQELISATKAGDDKKHGLAMSLVEAVTDIANTVTEVATKWDTDIVRAGLDYEGIPSHVLDYVDELIDADILKNAKDVIALFETGELRGIITSDNKIDKDALAAFEKRMKMGKTVKASAQQETGEEDVF